MTNISLRFTAAYSESTQWGLVRGVWRWIVLWLLTYSTVVAGALAVCVGLYSRSGNFAETLYLSALLIFLIPLTSFLGGALRGLKYTILGQLPEFIVRPASFLILISAVLLLGRPEHLSPQQIMALHVLAALFAVVLGWLWLRPRTPVELPACPPLYESDTWRRAAYRLCFMAGMAVINNQADILMLGWLAHPEDVGVYRVAVQGSLLVSFVLAAVNLVIAPQIARLHTQGRHAALQRLLTWSARASLVGSLPIALAFWFIGRLLLERLFGSAFASAYWALAILTFGQMVNVAMGSVGSVLNMTGHERESAIGSTAAACVNVALNAILIPTFGINGAAIAGAISMTLWNVVLAWYVYRRTKLHCTVFGAFAPTR